MKAPDRAIEPGQSAETDCPVLISGRQREVLYLAAQGLTDRAIARRLAIAPRTVRMHLQMVREALGARNTTHAVAIALSWRILPDSAATATQI